MNKKNIIVIIFFMFCLMVSIGGLVSYSNVLQTKDLVIESITPLYNEDSGIIVSDNSVIFNDKDQTVKYKVIVRNTYDYDVKVSDIKLSEHNIEFLNYTIDNIDSNQVIKTNETKEFIINLFTFKTDGWGRNFDKQLSANVLFEKAINVESNIPIVEDNNSEDVTGDNIEEDASINNDASNTDDTLVTPEEDLDSVPTQPGKNTENGNEEVDNPYTSDKGLLVILVLTTGVSMIGIILVYNGKLTKYIVFVITLGAITGLVSADEILEISIDFNVEFKSQNVMEVATSLDENQNIIYNDYWNYADKIKNIYFKTDNTVIDDYEYKFDVTDNDNKRVTAYLVKNIDNANYFDLYVVADGVIYFNEDSSYYFANMKNIEEIYNLSNVDTSNVTNMSYLFYNYGYNSDEVEVNFDYINTSKTINMSYMFGGYGYNSSSCIVDLNGINTSKVTNMSGMFSKACYSTSSFLLDVSKFNTSSVTNMSGMFMGTGYNDVNFNLDLSNFDTSNVTDMSFMFNNTGYKSTSINIDFSKFDTSSVTNMSGMFCNYGRLNPSLVLDLSSFDTSNVTNMYRMFMQTGYGSTNFEVYISNLDFSSVENSKQMFKSMGYKSTNMKFDVLINVSNIDLYSEMFRSLALKDGTLVTINYSKEANEFVDTLLATKSSGANVVKGKLIVEVDDLEVGDEVFIENERFNVISNNEDTVTILAQYSLGSNYIQNYNATDTDYKMTFSNSTGWEYTPGPKEIDIQTYDGVAKTYINNYVAYLKETTNDMSLTGTLMTLGDLKNLGCTINDDYTFDYATENGLLTCADSAQASWLINGQTWWLRSASANNGGCAWYLGGSGRLGYEWTTFSAAGIRPVITISKNVLKDYLKA